jgi:hypothetical protein
LKAKWISMPLATAASCAFALAATELAIRLLDLFPAARAAFAASADTAAEPAGDAAALQTQIHPFLGWMRRPGVEVKLEARPLPVFPPEPGPSEWARRQRRANLFGYLSQWNDYRDVPRDHFVVGVFGGSVAGQLVDVAGDVLRDALRERLPELGASIDVLNFGSGGYKQPQQLMALAEMATLGVPLDLVVTLDGFNEVVFGMHDAQGRRHPLFPSRAHLEPTIDLALGLSSRREVELSGRVATERRRAVEVVRRIDASPWARRSELARAVGGALALRHEANAVALEAELQQISAADEEQSAAVASLPAPCLDRPDTCLDLVVELWANASASMAGLARSMGAHYVHALQPNQYLEGSKPLNAEERELLLRDYHGARSVQTGYPALRERGRRLREAGVAFYDLTQVFAGREESIYRDTCCHMNAHGYGILARALADAVADALHGGGGGAAQRR